jgi:hypothetical protein
MSVPKFKIMIPSRKDLIVFFGYYSENMERLSELFHQDPTMELFQNIFDENELERIHQEEINVIFSEYLLDIDDDIYTIKLKLFLVLQHPVEEMYLYSFKQEYINETSIRDNIGRFIPSMIYNIYANIYDLQWTPLLLKQTPELSDPLELNINPNEKYLIPYALGQFSTTNDFLFVKNPDLITDEFFETHAIVIVNRQILLTNMEVYKNTLFLSIAEDVLTEKSQNIQKYILKVYYPSIPREEDLASLKPTLMLKTQNVLTDEMINRFRTVDMFYNIYQYRTNELKYLSKGIKRVDFTIVGQMDYSLPLEMLFQLYPTSSDIPFTKYNTPKTSLNILRLFTNGRVTKDGKKIPVLSFGKINHINTILPKQFGFVLYQEMGKNELIVQLQSSGSIRIMVELNEIVELEELTQMLKINLKTMFAPLSSFLQTGNYMLPLFETLFGSNIMFHNIVYGMSLKSRAFDIEELSHCLNVIFNIEVSKPTRLQLRYKRVANFDIQLSQEAFVINSLKQGISQNTIEKGLRTNYQLSAHESVDIIRSILTEIQSKANIKRKIKTNKQSPGILVTIENAKATDTIIVQMEDIDNIFYIQSLGYILDSVFRIIINKGSTTYPVQYINSICNLSKERLIKKQINFYKQLDAIEDAEIANKEESPNLKVDELLDLFSDEESDMEGGAEKQATMVLGQESKEQSDEETEETEDKEEILRKRSALLRNSKYTQSLDNTSLHNYFKNRMEEYDKSLFVTKKGEYYEGYSRTCQSSVRRQPVVLNKEELDKIEKTTPGMFSSDEILQYSTDPNNELYYVCPRYWCLLDNTVLTEDEAKSGVCGNIIPHDKNTIVPGSYVYEFFSPKVHGTQEKYKKLGPAFLQEKEKGDPCVPCCFKKWDTARQRERLKECNAKEIRVKHGTVKSEKDLEIVENVSSKRERESEKEEKKEQPEEEKEEEEEREEEEEKETAVITLKKDKRTLLLHQRKNLDEIIVKSGEKFPLEEFTWGYIPVSVEMFFGEFNIDCQISRTNQKLKPNHTCFLRHGVEYNPQQSFLACIKDIKYSYNVYGKLNNIETPTLSQMKQGIIQSITLDKFITLQNGNLIHAFSENGEMEDYFRAPFTETDIFKKLFPANVPGTFSENSKEVKFFNIICLAYQNYLKFLSDDQSFIDYTYTWDLFSQPGFFTNGANLLILNLTENDITNNIELICPTNHYSGDFYDPNKKSLIILKKGDFYEPLYMYRTKQNFKSDANAYFDTKRNSTLSQKFKDMLTKIIRYQLQSCNPLPSLPKDVYSFSHPIILSSLIKLMEHMKGFTVVKQLCNLNGKVIGIQAIYNVKTTYQTGFVPCYPSSIQSSYPYDFINDYEWTPYKETRDFLTNLYKLSKESIPCKIQTQIIESDMVVGFLTSSNQFIQISPPMSIDKMDDEIPTIQSFNYFAVDDAIQSKELDTPRLEFSQKIQMEAQSTNSFKTALLFLLNQPENEGFKTRIQYFLQNHLSILYDIKIEGIKQILQEISQNEIEFQENVEPQNMDCFFKRECKLFFNQTNAVSGENNQEIYYLTLADQIARYSRITPYLFSRKSYFLFNPVKTHLNENEMIIMQMLLSREYYEGQILETNKYVNYANYDDAEPVLKQNYSNEKMLGDIIQRRQQMCKQTIGSLKSSKWKACFPSSFQEMYFRSASSSDNFLEQNKLLIPCGYETIAFLLEEKTRKKYTETEINEILYDEYVIQMFVKYINQKLDRLLIYDEIIDVSFTPPVKPEFKDLYKEYYGKLLDVLKHEGKTALIKKQVQKNSELHNIVKQLLNDTDYFITNMDIWVIVTKFEISSYIMSSFAIRNADESNKYKMCLYRSELPTKWVVIIAPGTTEGKIPVYKFIWADGIFIPREKFKCGMEEEEVDIITFLVDHRMKVYDYKVRPKRIIIDV